MITHDVFKATILPEKERIMEVMQNFSKRVKRVALEHIVYLRDESYAYDHNLMDQEPGWHEMLMTWNDWLGPKNEASELQEKLRISDREVQHYIDWLSVPRSKTGGTRK